MYFCMCAYIVLMLYRVCRIYCIILKIKKNINITVSTKRRIRHICSQQDIVFVHSLNNKRDQFEGCHKSVLHSLYVCVHMCEHTRLCTCRCVMKCQLEINAHFLNTFAFVR